MKTDPADAEQLAACVQYKKTSQYTELPGLMTYRHQFCSVSSRGEEVDESAIRKAVVDLPDHNSSRHRDRSSRIFRTSACAERHCDTASDSATPVGASQLCSHP